MLEVLELKTSHLITEQFFNCAWQAKGETVTWQARKRCASLVDMLEESFDQENLKLFRFLLYILPDF